MTTTEKILEEFDKKFVIHCSDGDILGKDGKNEVIRAKLFLSAKIHQVVAEERERMVDKIRKAPMWKLVPNTPRMIMCSDKEFDNLLSSPDSNPK